MPFLLLGAGALLLLVFAGKGGPHLSVDQAVQRCPALDPHLSNDLARAVCTALVNETNPAELHRFADSLLPEYPVAAGLLQKKAHG